MSAPPAGGFALFVTLTTGEVVKGITGPPVPPTSSSVDVAYYFGEVIKDVGACFSFRSADGAGWVVIPCRMVALVQVYARDGTP